MKKMQMARPVTAMVSTLVLLFFFARPSHALYFENYSVTLPGLTGPVSVATGDFNGDSKLDLVVANAISNNVSVYFGKGDGTFQASVDYAAGISPTSVTVGDFNGDGKLDLAVVNAGSNDVSILLGNGDGTFQPAVNYATGMTPTSVVVGDVNGDSKLDLIVAGWGGVWIFFGNGDGTFQPAVFYAAGFTPQAMIAGDFNGDSKLDLALANAAGNEVSILLGNGDGTFQPAANYAGGTNPVLLAAGDFNGDMRLDLAVVNNANGSVPGNVTILLGNGDGSFQPSAGFSTSGPYLSSAVAIGDFNGDSKFDIAIASGSYVSIFLGNGDGTFQLATFYAVGEMPKSVAIGDFNGDSKLDIAAANEGSNNVSVLLGNGDGSFREAFASAGLNPRSITSGDFNGDSKLDLAVANASGNNVFILLGNGDGSFKAPASYAAGNFPGWSMTTGDFNGDIKLDLVVTNSDGFSTLLGNGDGTFRPPVYHALLYTTLALTHGDFNGDGKLDLAIVHEGYNTFPGGVTIFLGNGDGTFQETANYVIESSPRSITAGDFNGDGQFDLAVADFYGGLSIFLGNGDGTFQPAVNYTAGSWPWSVTAGDFNGDGKLDLAVANWNNISIFLGNGDGTFQPAVNFDTWPWPSSLITGDFNGDGRLDLAAVHDLYGYAAVFLGNGDGTFQPEALFTTGSEPISVTAGNFNGDSRLDLAVANYYGGKIAILLNAFALTIVESLPGSGTVTSIPAGITCGVQCIGSYTPGTVVTLTATPNTGSSFAGWNGDCNSGGQVTMTGDKTCTALFTLNTYTVTPSAGPNGGISPNTPQGINFNFYTTFNVTPDTGYHVASVTGCGGMYYGTPIGGGYTTAPIISDCTVSAGFLINSYTVTPTAGPNGSTSPNASQTINYNGTTTFTITPSAGYHIESVTGCGGTLSGNTYTTGPVTSDCTVSASFVMSIYTVAPSAGPNGSISPNTSQVVTYNGTSTFTVTPATGYHIASVAGCGGTLSGNTYTTGPVTSNCSVSANFLINTYTVTPGAGPNGSISPNTSQVVSYNGTSTFTVTPATGYHIASVAGCGGTLSGYTYTTGPVTSDCSVSASFAPDTASPLSRTGDLNGDGTVDTTDALKVLRIAVGLDSLTEEYLARGDVAPLVNGKPVPDGRIDIADAVVILRKAVGLVTW